MQGKVESRQGKARYHKSGLRVICVLWITASIALTLACGEQSAIVPVYSAEPGVGPWPSSDIKLLYDGDLGPDPCDYTTLSMLHEYHRRGMIELVGTIGVMPDSHQAATFSLYNQIYGNTIPFSVYHSEGDVPYSWAMQLMYRIAVLVATYGNPNRALSYKYDIADLPTGQGVIDPVEGYRKVLAAAQDNSITIYAAGPLFNFPAVLESGPDQYSNLGGRALLHKKVKEFIIMGGYFPASAAVPTFSGTSGAEYNWWALRQEGFTQAAMAALVGLQKPITFVGFEMGKKVPIGEKIVRRLGRNHPTSDAYYQYRSTFDGNSAQEIIQDNPAFDDIGLFYLVEGGLGTYFDSVPGSVRIDAQGANSWVHDGGGQIYLTLLPGVESELAEIISARITGDF